jgi:hypothetical protein
MTITRLSPAAEECVQAMGLSAAEQNAVRHCMTQYARPKHLCDVFKWLVFRVNNFFKGSQSEWEITKRVVHQRMLPRFQSAQPIVQGTPFANKVSDLTVGVAERLLNLCLTAHERNLATSEELRRNLRDVNLLSILMVYDADFDKIINHRLPRVQS